MSIEVNLPDNLTIHHIANHLEELKNQVGNAQTQITFNAAELETFDTSGLQSLLVLVKNAQTRDVSINWQNVQDSLLQGAQSLGLAEALELN